jgi:hypothetical protein
MFGPGDTANGSHGPFVDQQGGIRWATWSLGVLEMA